MFSGLNHRHPRVARVSRKVVHTKNTKKSFNTKDAKLRKEFYGYRHAVAERHPSFLVHHRGHGVRRVKSDR
jgi:hypothetical protein